MERLVRAGLFGAGLVPVNSPQLVARYNAALEQLGLQPTQLTSFDIDGIGWSWQVAQEKGDNFYLCAGPSNPMGVIMTPEQRGRPLYFPYNSYDRDMVDAYFASNQQAVVDITSTAFLGLNIDQELTTYQDARDLLLVTYVTVRSIAGGLFDASKHQRQLVARFTGDGMDWFDPKLRSEIIESGKQWGDLRHRHTSIPDLRFDVKSFHTVALGGVFVLRSLKRGKSMLVVEDPKSVASQKNDEEIYDITDASLIDRLLRENVLELDLDWYRRHPDVLAEKKDGILVDLMSTEFPDIPFARLKVAQKRQYASRLANKLPTEYHELERLARRLKMPEGKSGDVSPELQRLLVRPHHRLPPTEREVIWLFLCRLQPLDVQRLYESDKNKFFEQYVTWSDLKRDWAVQLIAERYVPRMTREAQKRRAS